MNSAPQVHTVYTEGVKLSSDSIIFYFREGTSSYPNYLNKNVGSIPISCACYCDKTVLQRKARAKPRLDNSDAWLGLISAYMYVVTCQCAISL